MGLGMTHSLLFAHLVVTAVSFKDLDPVVSLIRAQ